MVLNSENLLSGVAVWRFAVTVIVITRLISSCHAVFSHFSPDTSIGQYATFARPSFSRSGLLAALDDTARALPYRAKRFALHCMPDVRGFICFGGSPFVEIAER
jgi:hypothetical protein